MASILNNNSLIINDTQEITGISTTVNEGNYNEIPTAKAVYDLLAPLVLVSLTVSGNWSNPQYTEQAPDTTGLTFTATFLDGSSKSVTPTVSPSSWGSTVGTQTATFSYSQNGITVTATKTASVIEPWAAMTITLTNPNSGLAFRSISGNLYTNSACTTKASTNTKYTGTTFYYKSNETKPTGSYIYNYGDGRPSTSEPSQGTITTYYNEGSLTACLGTSGYCWSGDKKPGGIGVIIYPRIDLSNGSWAYAHDGLSYHRVRASTF